MNKVSFRPASWAFTACCVLVGTTEAGAQSVAGSFERTLTVETPVVLEVRTGSGSIVVRGGSGPDVDIAGTIHVWDRWGRDDAEELARRIEADPPIEVEGNRITLGGHDDADYGLSRGGVSISYEIEVPRATQLTASTGSGSHDISGISGAAEVSSGSGRIVLRDIGGAVVARAGSGSIEADGVAGAFKANTGSGSIRLEQSAAGDVDVSSGSGSSDLRGVEGALHARAGSGRISVEGQPRGRWDVQTGSGSINLDLPDDAAFTLDARASSGGLATDHPVAVRGSVERGQLGGDVRGGGPMVRVRAGSGSVSIE